MGKISFMLFLLLSSSFIFGQTDKGEVYIISDKKIINETEADIYKLRVIYITPLDKRKLIEVSNYKEDFKLLGSIYETDGSRLLLFENFDSITGSTKYFFVDLTNLLVYSTGWLDEVLLPDFFSFDKNNQTLKCISIDVGMCGVISYYPLNKEEHSKMFDKELNEYEILQKIPTCSIRK